MSRPADGIALRVGTAADLDAAVALWDEAQSARLGVATVCPGMRELESERLTNQKALFLILEESQMVIGIALASPAREGAGQGAIISGLAHISSVAVKPTHWGRGLGRQLLNALMERLPERGYSEAQLWTQPTNSRALTLYLSLGFEYTGDEQFFRGEHIRLYMRRL